MQLNATHNNSRLILEKPMRVRHQRVPVTTVVPDEEMLPENKLTKNLTGNITPDTKALLDELWSVLGEDYVYHDDGRTDKERFANEIREYYK